jgi:hypothetical protein
MSTYTAVTRTAGRGPTPIIGAMPQERRNPDGRRRQVLAPARRAFTEATDRAASAEAVRSLIDAAGPLSLGDIAGGLGIAVAAASTTVDRMLAAGCLRQDEWERHTLRGTACERD